MWGPGLLGDGLKANQVAKSWPGRLGATPQYQCCLGCRTVQVSPPPLFQMSSCC